MPASHLRLKFDPAGEFFVVKPMRLNGVDLKPGRDFDKTAVAPRRLRQLYDTRYLGMRPPMGINPIKMADVDPSTLPKEPETVVAPVLPPPRTEQPGTDLATFKRQRIERVRL